MSNESFIELFGTDDLSLVPVHYFADFRKFCAHQESSQEFIERLDASALQRFSIGLLETVLRQFDDLEEVTASSVRRAIIMLTAFYNAAARSQRFRKTVEKHTVLHWLTLLRFEPIRTEVLACLTVLARELHKAFFLDDGYAQLLSDLVTLWNIGHSDDQRAWISPFFASLLEDDYGFLSFSFASLERETFTDLLAIVETLVDMSSTGKQIKIHPNNIRFCLDLFERIDFELSNSPMPFISDTGSRLTLLTDIFASAALQRPLYDDSLHNEQRAMRLICGMLKSILDAELATISSMNHSPSLPSSSSRKRNMSVDPDENSIMDASRVEGTQKTEKETNSMNPKHVSTTATAMVTSEVVHPTPPPTPERHDDHPPDAKYARRELDEFFKSSGQMKRLIMQKQISLQVIANIKQAAVRCIGNLCFENPQNRILAAQMDAVYLVIQCGRRNENDRPFLVQWAISSLKQLCLNCPENQEKLLNLDKRPNLVVNLERLLQTLGLKAVRDEATGELKLEKLDEI